VFLDSGCMQSKKEKDRTTQKDATDRETEIEREETHRRLREMSAAAGGGLHNFSPSHV